MEQPYGLGVQILGALWFTRAATRLYLDNCEDIVRNMLNFSAYTRNGRGSGWWGVLLVAVGEDSGGEHAWMYM